MKKSFLIILLSLLFACSEESVINLEPIENNNSFSSSPNGGYINIPNSQYLNISDNITIAFWTKLNSLGPTDSGGNGYNQFVNKWDGPNHQYVVSNNKRGIYTYFNDTNNQGHYNLAESNSQPKLNKWEFITTTYSQGEVKIYLNAELILEKTLEFTPMKIETDINIGGAAVALGDLESVDGLMDDVQIWSKPLSQIEIRDLMNNPPTGNEEGLVGYWNFETDSSSEASVNDSSIFKNNGTMKDTDGKTIDIVLSSDTPY